MWVNILFSQAPEQQKVVLDFSISEISFNFVLGKI